MPGLEPNRQYFWLYGMSVKKKSMTDIDSLPRSIIVVVVEGKEEIQEGERKQKLEEE